MQTGQIIQKLRKQHNMTQSELAAGVFVSRDLVAKWETGERRPDSDAILAMATLFGISPSQIENTDESIKEELAECIPEKTDFTAGELKEKLNNFLKSLRPKDCDIFIMRYYYRKSADEIADGFSMKSGSVYSSLSRTRKKLRSFLKEGKK